ncbi:hypothetical protein ORJ04_22145 [Rheinheimera baltica]|uniref:Thioredoxin domain-containing protein n=1 Tax=Rheinheimera baltica TaxID=67576 RepID=A0ABT9I5H3_9GAMM|nr:hypothetical protein [Rheinheimera baltica]MDP5138653.1 hypothetical protein [Rheinheimera baltica]MDP5141654.1 hypothetical protein [Rheinheimera baltica]MDP5151309.1 hypothetical protein [Rheinheimera baltica]
MYLSILSILLISSLPEPKGPATDWQCADIQSVWQQATAIELSQDEQISAEGILVDGRLNKFEMLFERCAKPRFLPELIPTLSNEQLHLVMLTMQKILFYNKRAAPEQFYLELLKMVPNNNSNKQRYIMALLEHHLLKANLSELVALEKEFSVYIEKPDISNASNSQHTNLIRLHRDGNLEFISKDITKGSAIVFIGSPLCAFSRSMASWLSTQKNLPEIIWLTKPVYKRDAALLSDYRNSTGIAYDIVYNSALWPQIRYWGTPTAYFMLNGEVIHQIVGWPDNGREAEFKLGLRKIGARPAETP